MADDWREAGARAPPEHFTRREPLAAAEQLHMPCAEDECEEVSPSDVLVHGRGNIEEVLEVLHDIARTCRRKAEDPAAGGPPRKVANRGEFDRLARRLHAGQAEVVLRKLFLYKQGTCCVMQEIWIQDKQNPDAVSEPLKEYAVVHVHHHWHEKVHECADIDICKHLESVDAINVRHILGSRGRAFRCHGDNPFRQTWIEPSGNTLFPQEKWRCKKCGCSNAPNKMQCVSAMGAGKCDGSQKCTNWRWRGDQGRDANFHFVLAEADKLGAFWVSGSGKDRDRTAGAQAKPSTLEALMSMYEASEPTRGPRKDLRTGPLSCQSCQRSPCLKTCTGWKDLNVAMLCIGISKYSHMTSLPNAARDARKLHDKMNEIGSRCKAEVREDVQTREDLKNCIRFFLQREEIQKSPPPGVLIEYSGHGMQKGGNVYLLPGNSNPEDPKFDPKTDPFPLGDILRFCRTDLDDHAAREKRKEVSFVVIIDACRDSCAPSDSGAVDSSLDQHQRENPQKWAICYSCSRDSTAKDGAFGGYSPFVTELLDDTEGIFAQGVPLGKGLNDACIRLEKRHSDQVPIPVRMHSIPSDLYLFPPGSEILPQEGMEGGATQDKRNVDSAMVKYFSDHGCAKIAYRLCEDLRITDYSLEYLTHIKDDLKEHLETPSTCDWLTNYERRIVIKIICECTAHSFARHDSEGSDPAASQLLSPGSDRLSQASTPLMQSPRDREVVGIHHEGDPQHLREHVELLLEQFNTHYQDVGASQSEVYELSDWDLDIDLRFVGRWTFCMLIWSAFVGSAKVSQVHQDDWLSRLKDFPEQQGLLSIVDGYVIQGKIHDHPQLDAIKAKVDQYNRPEERHVAAIAVVDIIVQEHLAGDVKTRWQTDVVKGWYESRDAGPEVFLLRANRYLRESIGSIQILQKAFETGSYVMYMTMSPLAAVLLFEHLELAKCGCMSDRKSVAATATVGDSQSLIHGFRLFVSSSGRVFSVDDVTDMPAPSAMPVIIQGLRCLAHFEAEEWEMLGPMHPAQVYVQEATVTAGKLTKGEHTTAASCPKPEDFDSGDDESGDAPVLTTPKAKEGELEASTEVSDQTDIFQACAGGHLKIVKRLVEQARVLLTAETKNGSQPIHIACFEGHIELVKWLEEQDGVSLAAKDNYGWQPIHGACVKGQLELVKCLAEREEVSLTAKDKTGSQPIHIACFGGHLELVKWLADEGGVSLTAQDNDGGQPIHCACDNGHFELVKWLAGQYGVSMTAEDNAGLQPIHRACNNGHLELVKWLKEQDGVSLTAKTKNGSQPIHRACEEGQLKVAQWLANEGGVSLTAEDNDGCQPIHCAYRNGHLEVVKWLQVGMLGQEGFDNWMNKIQSSSSHDDDEDIWVDHENIWEADNAVQQPAISQMSIFIDPTEDDLSSDDVDVDFDLVSSDDDDYKGHLEVVKWLKEKDGQRYPDDIHRACEEGHLKVVQWLANEGGVSLTAEDKNGWQPIHFACQNGHLKLVKWLAARVLLTAKTKQPRILQPIHIACFKGHLELVNWLLEQDGLSLDIPIPDDGRTPLHLAANEDHADVVSLLLEAKAAVDGSKTEKSHRTPLIDACFKGRKGAASVLIKAGANINARTIKGATALHRAAASGNASLVALLLEHRADVNARDRVEWTPLYNYVLNYKPDGVDHAHVGVVSELLKARANINIRSRAVEYDERVNTPLHVAARRGIPEMVSALLSASDADPDVRDTFKQTPLHTTSSSECAQLLLTSNANPDALDQQNLAPLHVAAAKRGNLEVMAVLLQHANINLKDSKGRTALHLASQNAQERAVSALVDAGADIHARNKRQETPLHSVSNTWQKDVRGPKPCGPYERQRCAEILLKAGADPDAANCDGECPLHFAVRYCHPEVAKVLLEYDAATNLRSRKGQTPLDLCQQFAVEKAQSGDSDIFQELLNILKQAAKDRPAGFSTELLQKHEQSPQGAFSPMLEVVGLTSDDAHSTSSKASGASTRTARSMASALEGAKSDDARSVTSFTSSSSKASKLSAASTRSAASSGAFIPRKDCRFWLNGSCRFGQACTFRHDPQKEGTGLGHKQGDGPGTGARVGPPAVRDSTSTPPRPAATPKSSGSAPRAQGATATYKNPFGMSEEQEDDE